MKYTELELIKEIKNIFKEKGGARHVLIDDHGQICIFQAYVEIADTDIDPYASYFPYWEALDAVSCEMWGDSLIDVNNNAEESQEKVLAVVDARIHQLESVSNG